MVSTNSTGAKASRFGIISDIHLSCASSKDRTWHNPVRLSRSHELLATALQLFGGTGLDHLLVAGDVTDRGDEESTREFVAALTSRGIGAHVAIGNHDVRRYPTLTERVLAEEKGRISVPPVDGVRLGTAMRIASPRIFSDDGGLTAKLQVGPCVDDWPDDLTVYLSHFPVISLHDELTAAGFAYAGDLGGGEDILQALQSRTAPTIVVSGHLHARAATASGHLLQISQPALVEAPHEVGVMEIEQIGSETHKWRVAVEWRPVHPANTTRLPALCSTSVTYEHSAGAWKLVEGFDGG